MSAAVPAPGSAVPGELIVGFEPGTTGAQRGTVRDQADVDLERALPIAGLQVVKTEDGQSAADARRELERSEGVPHAEPNFYRTATATPNGTHFRYLWGASDEGQRVSGTSGTAGADIRATEAWDITAGSPGTPTAVIDSGIELDHPDLSTQISGNPGGERRRPRDQRGRR